MSNHIMLPTPQSIPSAAPYNENAMAPYVNRKAHIQSDPTTRAYVLRRTPDEIVGAVLGALYPVYQIDETHQLALCNIIGQSFEYIKDAPGGGAISSTPIAVLKPPPQVKTTQQRYEGYHNNRKSTSAIINHHIRAKYGNNDKTRGGFGGPKYVNGAFYFHHKHPVFKKTYEHVDLSQYEISPTQQSRGSYRHASVEMSPSKARKDRMDHAMLHKRAASFSMASTVPKIIVSAEGDDSNDAAQDATEVKKEDGTDVDEAADNTAHTVNVTAPHIAIKHLTDVAIKVEEDDSGIDMNDLPMDLTKSFIKVENSNVSVSHGSTMNVSQSFYQVDESDDESDIHNISVDAVQPFIKNEVSDNVSVTHGSTMNTTQSFYQADDSNSDSGSESDIKDTHDSTQQDAVFTQPGASTSCTQLTDTIESPEPTNSNKATETKKSGPVRLKLNLPKPRRSSRIAKQAPSSASSSSASPAPSVASSLGKRTHRDDEENGEPNKRSKTK